MTVRQLMFDLLAYGGDMDKEVCVRAGRPSVAEKLEIKVIVNDIDAIVLEGYPR